MYIKRSIIIHACVQFLWPIFNEDGPREFWSSCVSDKSEKS